ncbi:GL12195 [Drosophila persimilis]|uniref:GL12195 n=1 Tax=Drosophila persimilis TaxID=7234 RepID=B4GMP9_DROPE|nr:melanoma-associated antigen 9 [Drosophila persimilis]XP_026851036.1 melanoma-associated antigen 9 [Drosophila persimilis]EDW38123.1 GL12195 [Drosophila persimilis]
MASTSRAGRAGTSRSGRNATQSSQSQQPEVLTEIDDKVRTILKYILDHSAAKIPMKEKDLVPLAGTKPELHSRLPLVAKLLAERYGIRLHQLNDATKMYICMAEAPMASIHELTPEQRPQLTLLFLVLMYIFLRQMRVEDTKLYAMLAMLGIRVDEDHAYFGSNLRKQIEDTFVKQRYVKRERSQPDSAYEEVKTYFIWGLRAKAEFTYEQIVEFSSKILKQHPTNFSELLEIAKSYDNNN